MSTRRRVAGHDRGLDRRRQAGVDPVAGEQESLDRRRASAAAAAHRAPARTSSASRAPPGLSAASPRARPAAPRALRASAVATSSSLPCATIASAPLEISDRCDATPPTMARRSKTHWKLRPGRPTSGSCITARSNHRLTVTIGRLAQRGRVGHGRCQRGRRLHRTARRNANHGTVEITTGASIALVAHADAASRARRRSRRCAGALTRTSRPRCFEPRARRLGIQLVERHRRQHQRRRRRIGPNIALEHAR